MERFRDSGIERQTATFDGICRILPPARRGDAPWFVMLNEVKHLAAAIGAAAALFFRAVGHFENRPNIARVGITPRKGPWLSFYACLA